MTKQINNSYRKYGKHTYKLKCSLVIFFYDIERITNVNIDSSKAYR